MVGMGGGSPRGPPPAPASAQDGDRRCARAGGVPRFRAAARRAAAPAGGQCAPLPQPAARPARPLARRVGFARGDRTPGGPRGSPMPDTPTAGACARRSSGADGSTRRAARPGSLPVPLPSRSPRRLLEQQPEEPPRGEPQQERHRKPEQQQRLPCGPHAPMPEPAASRGRRARR